MRPGGFLSCLCGSEVIRFQGQFEWNFLSCLCGSEDPETAAWWADQFLSCLCGSEVLHISAISLIVKELTLNSPLNPVFIRA